MNFLDTLLNFLKEFWPFAIVEQTDRGVFYFFGRAQKWVLRPGLYAFVPWFTDIVPASIVPEPLSSPLLNITLKDGGTLGYSISFVFVVEDVWKALNCVDEYKDNLDEIVTAIVSEKLAEVEASRLDPASRKRLCTDLVRWVNLETTEFGVQVRSIRFTNFAINQRAYRLLMDTATGLE